MSQPVDPSGPTSEEPRQNGPTPSLVQLCVAVDVVIEAVEDAHAARTDHLGRDVNDALLAAAYGRAYRCMRSIRELAERGQADDATVLLRALVSLVARSLYLVAPDDAAEREARLDRAIKSWADDMVRALEDLEANGFPRDELRDRIVAMADHAEQQQIPRLPNDHDILDSLCLGIYYARVYRLASDVVHFSIGSALDGFIEVPARGVAGGRVGLRQADADRSEEALRLALITYSEFLQRCEPVIGHGVTPTARRVLDRYLNSVDEGTT